MEFRSALLGLKEGQEHGPLIEAAVAAVSPGAVLHLATFVRVGTKEDELPRLDAAGSVLRSHAETLEHRGFEVRTDVRLLAVNAAGDLLDIATEHAVDLIVIGLVKRTRVGKALLGSDAQRILLGSPCPVLGLHI